MSSPSQQHSSTPSLFLCFLVFLVLKLTGHIDLSWWLVTMPLWIDVAASLMLGIVSGSVVGVAALVVGIFTHILGPLVGFFASRWEQKQMKRIADRYADREAAASRNTDRTVTLTK